MTAILHQLRTRSRALTHGLLLVLLATWLAAVCPHCLAQAAEVPAAAPAGHCHSEAPPPAEAPVAGHDCCPQSPVCTGAGCAQMSSLAAAEPAAFAIAEPGAQVPPASATIGQAYPAAPPPPTPLAQRIAADACPLYLRHCSLLN
ncbi:MAG: hypothetical protein ACLGH6_07375 [Gammaproteobacteria bacterium]